MCGGGGKDAVKEDEEEGVSASQTAVEVEDVGGL
jgi:hypothetical protein